MPKTRPKALLKSPSKKKVAITQANPVYNPQLHHNLPPSNQAQEVVNCYAYSRTTGKAMGEITLTEVRRTLEKTKKNKTKKHSPSKLPSEAVDAAKYTADSNLASDYAASDALNEDSDVFIWLGLYEPTPKTLQTVQTEFDLHDLALEDAVAEHQRAKIESYANGTVFIVMQTPKLENDSIHYGKTSLFMGKNFIITIRTGPSVSYASVRDYYKERPEKLRLGPIFILQAILDFVVDNYMPIIANFDAHLREQEKAIFSYDFDRQTLRQLYDLKMQLIHMRGVILPMQDISNFFLNHKKDELVADVPSSAKPYFRDINDHLLQALDAVNGLNEMLSVAMDTYMAMVNMGQNEVVRKLAAWAGILAVPTAVAGIYGMNFDFMPELHYKYAYFIVLAIIFIACAILYRQFKRSGWL